MAYFKRAEFWHRTGFACTARSATLRRWTSWMARPPRSGRSETANSSRLGSCGVSLQEAFADYYRTTILSEETDPNKLHDLKAALDGYQVYADAEIDQLVTLYLGGADRDQLDPILEACVALYKERLDEDGQVDFKGKAKAFERAYGFLASILPYTHAEWEKLSIFLNFLVPKLPAPVEEDLSKGILESIDMDSYRVEKKTAIHVQLADEDAEIQPVPTNGGGHIPELELDRLGCFWPIFFFADHKGSMFLAIPCGVPWVGFLWRLRLHRISLSFRVSRESPKVEIPFSDCRRFHESCKDEDDVRPFPCGRARLFRVCPDATERRFGGIQRLG